MRENELFTNINCIINIATSRSVEIRDSTLWRHTHAHFVQLDPEEIGGGKNERIEEDEEENSGERNGRRYKYV